MELDPAKYASQAKWIKEALGGAHNLKSLQAVAKTRLRVELNDSSILNLNELEEKAGVQATVNISPGIYHLIIGHQAEQLGDLIKD